MRGHVLISMLVCLAVGGVAAPQAGAAVVLNEVNCEGTDWVELVNTSGTEADISGWLLTDDALDRDPPRSDHRHIFPASAVIPASGNLVVERDASGASGFPFGVSCGSDTLRLADGDGARVDDIAVPALTAATDTWGRYPNGGGPWVQTISTKGAPNEPSTDPGDPPPDLAGWMFEPDQVVRIELGIPQSSRDALAADPDEYTDGTFSLQTSGGTYGPLNVGVRLKGGRGSFQTLDGKAAFKVKFNHSVPGQRLLGLEKLTLNNMLQDGSMIAETLAYEAFRAAGVAAPRTGYAFVRVDGEDYGVYLNVETLDQVSLRRWFDSTRHLYEGDYGSDVSPGGAGAFEVDEGNEGDRSDLDALIAAANDEQGDWSEGMEAVADLQQMTKMWAVEQYAGHWDGYAGAEGPAWPNNYYLHSDASGRFRMLPWGTDQTWRQHLAFGRDSGLLFDKCMGDTSCAAMYRDALREVATTIAGLDLDGRAVRTSALLEPWQRMDPKLPYAYDYIPAFVEERRAFLRSRPAEAARWLDPPDDPTPPPLAKPKPAQPAAADPIPKTIEKSSPVPGSLASQLRTAARALRRLGANRLMRRRALRLRRVRALGPGVLRITATAPGVRGKPVVLRGRRSFSAAGRGAMTLRLTRAGRRLLRSGKGVRLSIGMSFRARDGGLTLAQPRTVVLKLR